MQLSLPSEGQIKIYKINEKIYKKNIFLQIDFLFFCKCNVKPEATAEIIKYNLIKVLDYASAKIDH